MFLRTCIITVIACVGGGIVAQLAFANSPNPAKDLFSAFRSYKTPVVRNDAESDSTSAASQHRLARTYAEQDERVKANAHFSLALQNAPPQQVPAIASDYAAFLMRTGDFHKAELIVRQALTHAPQNEEFIRMLARCLVLQDKITEGLRYYKSVGTEEEAREEIAAIYREQGNAEMLAVVEKKWGVSGTARPKSDSESLLAAATPKPSQSLPPVPIPTLTTKGTTPPVLTAASPKKSVPAVPQKSAVSENADVLAKTPFVQPLSRSEFFDTKVPIPVPVPDSAPQPMVTIAHSPVHLQKPASAAPVPKLPAPQPVAVYSDAEKLALDGLVLVNPVTLPTAPPPVLAQTESEEPPRPAVASRARKHYVASADTSKEVDSLFSVKPTAATVPAAMVPSTQNVHLPLVPKYPSVSFLGDTRRTQDHPPSGQR